MWQFTAIVVGRGGGWWTSSLGLYLPGCRESAGPGPLSSKPGQSCRSPISAAATGEHGLGLADHRVAVSQGTLEIPAAPFAREGMVFWEEG